MDHTFRNPDIANIKGLLGQFNTSWKLEVDKLPQDTQAAMNSIVNDKNSLAHGNDVILTLQDVIQYYKNSLVVINKLDEMLLPDNL